eukprot:TRINITY_DN70730_c0_g1_i1.p1 TRINITY_DN70730_c0_g1~~TRINITY_DN70730_c0_g1_i1.p1  ORF type:complete len:934 (+),score=154.36 TRINITY_DN70730_c0_g1_i1:71-2872(+)
MEAEQREDTIERLQRTIREQQAKMQRDRAARQNLVKGAAMSSKLKASLERATKRAVKVKTLDVCFVFDVTGSMQHFIDMAAQKIEELCRTFTAFMGEASVPRIAFVGYRDYDDDKPVEVMPFTTDASTCTAFLQGLEADGGGDICEDVLGGIEAALNLEWQASARVIFLLSQTPQHGLRFRKHFAHSIANKDAVHAAVKKELEVGLPDEMRAGATEYLVSRCHDLYSTDVRQWDPVDKAFEKMRALDINCVCFKLGDDIDRMLEVFLKLYKIGPDGKPLEIMPLKSEPETFHKLVVTVASQSVTSSMERHSRIAVSAPSSRALLAYKIDEAPPSWDSRDRWQQLDVPLVTYEVASLEDDLPRKTGYHRSRRFSFRPTPFAKGAMRFAFYLFDEEQECKLVGKVYQFDDDTYQKKPVYEGDMTTQAVARHLAQEFNKVCVDCPLEFVQAQLLIIDEAAGLPFKFMAVEPWIPGNYEKFTSNTDYVHADSDIAQAFSHFTFQQSEGDLLVADIQGVQNTLTDPQIHSRDDRFGCGNLGMDGIDKFFMVHRCNHICYRLALQQHPMQLGPQGPARASVSQLLSEERTSGKTMPSIPEDAAVGEASKIAPYDENIQAFFDAIRDSAKGALCEAHEEEELGGAIVVWEQPPRIRAIVRKSKAHEAGVQPGDIIHSVGGTSTDGKNRSTLLALLANADNALVMHTSEKELRERVRMFAAQKATNGRLIHSLFSELLGDRLKVLKSRGGVIEDLELDLRKLLECSSDEESKSDETPGATSKAESTSPVIEEVKVDTPEDISDESTSSASPATEAPATAQEALRLCMQRRRSNFLCAGKCGRWVEMSPQEYIAGGQRVFCAECGKKVDRSKVTVPCVTKGCSGEASYSLFGAEVCGSVPPSLCRVCQAKFGVQDDGFLIVGDTDTHGTSLRGSGATSSSGA